MSVSADDKGPLDLLIDAKYPCITIKTSEEGYVLRSCIRSSWIVKTICSGVGWSSGERIMACLGTTILTRSAIRKRSYL